jgi:hypothetical protein
MTGINLSPVVANRIFFFFTNDREKDVVRRIEKSAPSYPQRAEKHPPAEEHVFA